MQTQTANANNGGRTRAESLTVEAERNSNRVALDFGMQFARNHRQQLKAIRELREFGAKIMTEGVNPADLRDALYELKRRSAVLRVKTKMMTCLALS